MVVRAVNNHSVRIRHISNRYVATGRVVTDDIPFVSETRPEVISDVGEGSITLQNTWLTCGDGSMVFPLRDLCGELDIFQVYEDGALKFNGSILPNTVLGKDLTTVTIPLSGQMGLLNYQLSGIEDWTEDPTETIKRYLYGEQYVLLDNFDRDDSDTVGPLWTETSGDWDIVSGKAKCIATGYMETASISGFGKTSIRFKMGLANLSFALYSLAWAKSAATTSMSFSATRQLFPDGSTRHVYSIGVGQAGVLKASASSVTIFQYDREYDVEITQEKATSGSNTLYTLTLYIDGVKITSCTATIVTATDPFGAGKVELYGYGSGGTGATIDDLEIKNKIPIISEGTIDAYGSSLNTKVIFETSLNAIKERILAFMPSTDPLASTWEFEEVPVEYDPANPTAPMASINIKNRIGTNRDIVLSSREENAIPNRATEKMNGLTELICLGAGTSQVDTPGQVVAKSTNYALAAGLGLSMQQLKQFSDEEDYARLSLLAGILAERYGNTEENIDISPIEYEAGGFSVGDGYLVDFEQLGTSRSVYYRILNTSRVTQSSGATTLQVNFKDNNQSLIRNLDKEIRQLRNKARYDQRNVLGDAYDYVTETLDDGEFTTINKDLRFGDYYRIKKVIWNVEIDVGNYWQFWIDGIDRTLELKYDEDGNVVLDGLNNAYNIDITRFVHEPIAHTIEIKNISASTRIFATWGRWEYIPV